METFLNRVVKGILKNQSKYPLTRCRFILPNSTAVRYFRQSLAKKIDRPIFDNNIMTFERFVLNEVGYDRINQIQLLYRFYEKYKRYADKTERFRGQTKPDEFNEYLGWGSMILGEFDEIDAHGKSVKCIFSYLHEMKKIEKFLDSENSAYKKAVTDYKDFSLHLISAYEDLVEDLKSNKLAYIGMAVREFSKDENIEAYIEENSNKHHYFIGLMSLKAAEEAIIKKILNVDMATVYWDIDKSFFDDKDHPAGHYPQQYINGWDYFKKHPKPTLENFFNREKNIHIVGLQKGISQVKFAAQIIENNSDKDSRTALILGDQSLLIPALSAVSSIEVKWNANTGYSLTNTEVYTFFSRLLEMHQGFDGKHYRYDSVLRLSKTCYLSKIFQSYRFNLIRLLESLKKNHIRVINLESIKKLDENAKYSGEKSLYGLFFDPLKGSNSIKQLQAMVDISEFFFSQGLPTLKLKKDPKADYFQRFRKLFQEILQLEKQNGYIQKLSDLKFLLRQLVAEETVEFRDVKDPQVQIMSLLDSRLLDFDQVIITNLNEGTLPGGIKSGQWIPNEIRRLPEFKLDTYIEKDYLYSYHFFRVIQRASEVYLLYNKDSSGFSPGEKSRLIRYLEYFPKKNHKINYPSIGSKDPKPPLQKTIKKNDQIVSIVEDLLFEKGISYTGISEYLKNPSTFYDLFVLKVKELPSTDFTIDAMNRGNVIHRVLESLFKRFVGQYMTIHYYDDMIKELEDAVYQAYREEYGGDKTSKGINYLFLEVTTQHLKNYLESEKKQIKNGQSIKILAIEQEFGYDVKVPFGINERTRRPYLLKGKIDRIDLITEKGYQTLRIIDYKLGQGAIGKVDIEKIFEGNATYSDYYKLQLVFYATLCKYGLMSEQLTRYGHRSFETKETPGPLGLVQNQTSTALSSIDIWEYIDKDQVQFGDISFKRHYPRFEALGYPVTNRVDKSPTTLRDFLTEFDQRLNDLLAEIINPEIDFEFRESLVNYPKRL